MPRMDNSTSPEIVAQRPLHSDRLLVAMPELSRSYEQDLEWCVVHLEGAWREIRFHDYAEIYRVPGLYERLFYEILECRSPVVLRDALAADLAKAGTDAAELRVLDLGAGNGIMAEELHRLGVDHVVGVDLLPEARDAALRDRPGVYRDYHALDVTALTADDVAALTANRPNTLTCVAALGFGDIPPECFSAAYNLIADDGWIVFTIKDDFLSDDDTTGFSGLISRSVEQGALELVSTQRYQHRVATDRTPLYYTGVVARKRSDM